MKSQVLPPALEELVEELGKLPGIGRKTATRLAFHILNTPHAESSELARAIQQVKEKIGFCSTCFNMTEADPCPICSDESRNRKQICVVEDPAAVLMLERTNEYNGVYHVLGGVISPLDGIGPDDLHIRELVNRLENAEEIILALNLSTEGEATGIYISRLAKPYSLKITRLARGIPLGSALEFVDELTLSNAIKTRSEM